MNVRASLLFSVLLVGCQRDTTTTTTSTSASATTPVSAGATIETIPAKCLSTGTRGNGEITRTTRDAKGFTDVSLNGVADVDVREGTSFAVQVETDSNVQDMFKAETKGTTLVLGGSGSYCWNKLHVVVTMPLFHAATLQGSGRIDIGKTSAASDVALAANGSGRIVFRGAATSLGVTINGSGSVTLDTGSATATSANINGSGSVQQNSFTPGTVTKQINGSGSVAL